MMRQDNKDVQEVKVEGGDDEEVKRNFQKLWMAGGGGHLKGKLFMLLLPWGRVRRRRRTSLPRSRGPVTHIRLSGASVFRRRAPVGIPLPRSRRPNRNPWFAESGAEW